MKCDLLDGAVAVLTDEIENFKNTNDGLKAVQYEEHLAPAIKALQFLIERSIKNGGAKKQTCAYEAFERLIEEFGVIPWQSLTVMIREPDGGITVVEGKNESR